MGDKKQEAASDDCYLGPREIGAGRVVLEKRKFVLRQGGNRLSSSIRLICVWALRILQPQTDPRSGTLLLSLPAPLLKFTKFPRRSRAGLYPDCGQRCRLKAEGVRPEGGGYTCTCDKHKSAQTGSSADGDQYRQPTVRF